MVQHPQEAPDAEAVATPEEALSAWRALSPEEKVRLDVFAAMHARWRQRCEPGIEGKELLNEAARRILDGDRRWKLRKTSFLEFMFGTIRSISGDLERTNEGALRVVTRSVSDPPIGADSDDPINPIENISAGLDTPESFAIAQDRLKAIQDEFKDDEIAWLVLECLFVDGFSPDEARKHLGLTGLEFQAARKRISRRIPKFFLLN